MSQIIRNTNEPPTWRHTVLRLIWILIILPAGLLIVAAAVSVWLSEIVESQWGKLHRWANPHSFGRFSESATRPIPPEYL